MGKVTIKELALKLNLSIATVSRALRDNHETNIETRRRVKKLAEELGYTPDLYASNLRSRKTKTIGVIIPDITNSFFCQVIDGVEEICRENGLPCIDILNPRGISKRGGYCKAFARRTG